MFKIRGVVFEQNVSPPADEIMNAILPDAEQEDFPTGFSIVGHIGTSILFNWILYQKQITD